MQIPVVVSLMLGSAGGSQRSVDGVFWEMEGAWHGMAWHGIGVFKRCFVNYVRLSGTRG